MQVVINERYGKFGYDTDLKVMFHHWKGFLLLEEVKNVAEKTNALMKELGLVTVIADHNEMELFSDEVSAYISSIWIPEQEAAGVENIFVVLSEEAFAKFAAEEMHEAAKEKSIIDIQHFGNINNAIEAAKAYNARH